MKPSDSPTEEVVVDDQVVRLHFPRHHLAPSDQLYRTAGVPGPMMRMTGLTELVQEGVSITLDSRTAENFHSVGSGILGASRAEEWVQSTNDSVITVTVIASSEHIRQQVVRSVQRVLYFPDEV